MLWPVQAGDLSAAVEAFEDLKVSGLQPNKVTYCALISALGRDRRRGVRSAALAYELWRELQAQGERLDAAAYRAGAPACARRWQRRGVLGSPWPLPWLERRPGLTCRGLDPAWHRCRRRTQA